MDDDETNFTVRMEKSKRDEWKEAVNSSEQFGSLSQLVRYSVDQQIGRMGEEGMSKEEKEIMDKMEAENSRLRTLMEDMQETMEEIQESHLSTTEAEALAHNQTQTLIQEFNHGGSDE